MLVINHKQFLKLLKSVEKLEIDVQETRENVLEIIKEKENG